ncbi:hypothetical protein JRA49_003918, partial [Providencia stuartii]
MLDFIDRRADLNKLYQYKLKKLFNSRTSPVDVADLVFFNCDSEQQQTLCLDIKGNDSLYLSWWSDLFDFEKVNEKLCDDIFNNHDIFFYLLRVIPSVFMINNNDYYSGKNLFVTFFINQLKSDFSNINGINEDEDKTEILNYLMYELGLGERYSKYFIVKD